MAELVLDAKVGNEVVRIYRDEHPESPREWCNLGTFVGAHRRYDFFDKRAKNLELYDSWDEWREAELPKDCIYLPVYMYDHSELAFSTTPFSCKWDSGQLGWIYTTREKARQELAIKRISKNNVEKIKELMKNEIEVLEYYVIGEVYRYTYEADGEEIDSYYNFIGPLKEFINSCDISNEMKDELLENL